MVPTPCYSILYNTYYIFAEKETKTKQLTFADSDDDDDDDGNIFSVEKKAEIAEDKKKERKTSETKVTII